MDASEFVESVREDSRTELSRLGSSKALYAATGGEMDTQEVLRATADAELAARDTFELWADTDENEAVRGAFETAAEEEEEHYRTVTDLLEKGHDGEYDLPELHRFLRELDGSVERVGAFVGRTLASDATKGQVVGFFVGNAEPRVASTFRSLRGDLDDQLDRALDLLPEVCETDDDWARAREHAAEAIAAAYAEYVDSLESMGVDPKPVC